MLSQHARNGASVRRIASLRSLRSSSPSTAQSPPTTFVRNYVVSKMYRPHRRLGMESRSSFLLQERSLATAVDDFKYDGLSFSQMRTPSIPPFQSSTPRIHSPANFDPSSLLTIPQPMSTRQATRINTHGIPGDTEDMLPVFDACIRVGKLDRAALVLKRFNALGQLSGEERILLHNQYLRASLQQMRTTPDRQQAEQLHKWYELQIRGQGLPHTAETIACMLKASLLSERGARLNRLVLRYMGMVPGEAGLQVLSMADVLSDEDLAVITDICPTYNFVAEAEEVEVDLMDSAEEIDESELEFEPIAGSAAVPELVPTPQRGHGLSSLKRGLQFLSELQDADISKLSETERRKIQIQLERDSITTAIEKWRLDNKNLQKVGVSTALSASTHEGSLSANLGSWLEGMVAKLKEEFALIDMSESKVTKSDQDLARCLYGPLLQQADPARLAAVTILSVMNGGTADGADRGIAVGKLLSGISRLVQEDLQLQQRTASKKAQRRKVELAKKNAKQASVEDAVPLDSTAAAEAEYITPDREVEANLKDNVQEPWSMQLRAHVGSILLKTLIETAKIKVTIEHPTTKEMVSQHQPAFTHTQQPRRGKKIGMVCFNPHLVTKLKREPVGDFLAKHLPMIVQPKPWKRFNEGGFMASKVRLVRVKEGDIEQKLYTTAAIKRGDMDQVFKGLDVLGKTAWKINKQTLDVMIEAWNSGDAIANLPALDPQLEIPAEPDSSADPLEHRAWARAVKAIEHERSGLHSERCFMNLQLEIARALRNQTIYFPHNVDYRGRAYPIPTYLNHMGADHTRAILKFAKGKELGARGLRWLKIHLANVYGLDKVSFDEREAFATENLDKIRESVANPLKGSRWWLQAEDPWQCLSACFELAAAHELEDPTKFVSNLPVHQDGTCNGLQHYAALGGDSWGAKQVNLEPGDRPADVYTAVADLVKKAIVKDAEEGDPFGKVLNGKITRKVVKQTVMTNVYGVTFAGAKKQVCKQIDAIYPNLHKECGIPHLLLSTYIARHIFNALATMFRGAHDIQDWLGQIGGRVCRALTPAQIQQIADEYDTEKNSPSGKATGAKKTSAKGQKTGTEELAAQFRSTLVWTTPLRMPVVQPYRKSALKEIRTCMQGFVYPVGDQTDPVNRRKQLQGFPPNFIHSLDASHMLLSALQCDSHGLDFAAVHDSFWTHAADIDVMNGCLREAFIQIHEENVVGRLAAEFEARHKGSVYLAHIDPDSAVAKKIKELRANSKLSPKEELLLEYKRTSLKLSGNPWDLEAAKRIVTPASVYEEMAADEEDLMIKEDAKDLALGQIPEGEASVELVASEAESQEDHMREEGDEELASADDPASYNKQFLEDMKMSNFEIKMLRPQKRKPKKRAPLPVWLPLTIPAIPQKGDFDVTRLRESKYFFS
ncbi:DNA-directed RNA polymerase [Paramyrothecium foliicola]|nr:DNA-directed RNA polymerase [Paramyrothecium foliicola]